jgi:DNA repair protein SbcC/Rad50
MKILAIRGANLASLAREFEVDLAHGALGGSGLFAIVGNTGAGKSTLLDALCVALFDRTPRIGDRQRHAVLIGRGSDDASKVSAHDVRAILRRGAGRGYAEVDFLGDDGRRYRSRWEVHRARDKAEGALQSQEMSLLSLDDTEQLGGTKTETLAAIESRLGLTFDQFRRSALLAQGDFAAFLRADGKDRSELLERMTGTEIYSQLSIAAHRRGQAAEQRVKELHLAMGAVEVLSEEALAALRRELEQATAAFDAGKRALGEAERVAAAAAQRVQLSAGLADAERELARVGEQEQLAAVLRHEHDERRRAEELRPSWQAVQRAGGDAVEREQLVRKVAATVEKLSADAATSAHAVRRVEELLAPARLLREALRLPAPGSLEGPASTSSATATPTPSKPTPAPTPSKPSPSKPGAVPSLAPVRPLHPLAAAASPAATAPPSVEYVAVRIGEPVAWLTARSHLRGLAAAWPELLAMEARELQLRQSVAALERSAQRLRGDVERLASRRALLEQERQGAPHALEEANRRAAIASGGEGKQVKQVVSLETASRHEDAARRDQAQAERLAQALAQARAATLALAALHERRARELAAVAAGEGELATLEANGRVDSAALAEADGALARLNAAASLAHARAQLVEGDPCPLCGALEHPWRGRGAFDDLIVEQAAAVAVLRERVERGASATMARKLELAAQRLAVAALEDDAGSAAQQAAESAQRWRAALLELGELALVSDPNGEDAAALVAEHSSRATRALEKARDERRKVQALSNAAAEAAALQLTKRHDLEQVEVRIADVERERQELEDRVSTCLREVAAQRAARSELVTALAARLVAWEVPRQDAEQEPARVLEELRITVEAWRRHVDKLYEYEAALTHHLQRGEVAAAAAQTALTGARADLATYQAQHRAAVEARAAASEALQVACAAAGLDGEQLAGLLAAPASRLHELAEMLAEVARRADRARSVVDERRRALAAHDAVHLAAPALTAEALRALAERVAAEEERVVTLRARSERDLEDRRRREGMSAQMLAAERQGEVDRALAQVIGSHDGKLLRAFAQSLTLDTLLEIANAHLDELAPRYQLERVPRYDLELQVIDRDMGDEVRAVQSLSGGETFLVSLALALALSSLAAGSVRVRTLLIDEGFGTLDPTTLDGALAVLDALQATGRQVGIISHLPGLVERVGAYVKVIQRGSGRSEVVVAS